MAKAKKQRKDSDIVEAKTPTFRAPQWKPDEVRNIDKIAKLHALANPSDPFAADRARMEMRRGLKYPSDVKADAEAVFKSRGDKHNIAMLEKAGF